jgi:hypothetical protein
VPDLSIATVMGQAARATPVQVYVGLDSAPDGRTRVELAMAELDRTGGWDRSLRMLISPAGTGYVNYCAVAAAEYLTLGDLATVTWLDPGRPRVRHVPRAKSTWRPTHHALAPAHHLPADIRRHEMRNVRRRTGRSHTTTDPTSRRSSARSTTFRPRMSR